MIAKGFQITPLSARTNALEYHNDLLATIMRQIQKASQNGKMSITLPQSTPECILNHLDTIGYTPFQMSYINYSWYKITWLNLK